MAIKYQGTFTSNGDGTGTWQSDDGQSGSFEVTDYKLNNEHNTLTYKQTFFKSDGQPYAEVEGIAHGDFAKLDGKYSGDWSARESKGTYTFQNFRAGQLISTGSFTPLGTDPPLSPLRGTAKKADVFALTGAPEFGTDTADRITNFNPKEKDKLQIDVSDFGGNAAGTFKIAKNAKALTKALSSTTDFIYLKSTGELYYNEDGATAGFGSGGIFAILENKPKLTPRNIEFL
jgi:hypothetical protein